MTNDAASVEAAKGNGSLNNGQTFTLTANADKIVGTVGNDVINAIMDNTIAVPAEHIKRTPTLIA